VRGLGAAGLFGGLILLAAARAPEAETAARVRLTKELWPRERILKAIEAIKRHRRWGVLSERAFQKRLEMLRARLAGTYLSQSLSVVNPPLNFIQNGGFELINKNSRRDRSRWLWWGGWSWGGQYENRWEERPEYVHSGRYSARITCTGKPGRIGIMTPGLPQVRGAKAYRLTFWARGEGENRLFVNFESGARGSLRVKVPPKWTKYTVLGTPEQGSPTYRVFFYHIGKGTIWLDDVRLVPVGPSFEKEKDK